MILGEGRKKDTHKERAAAEHPEGDVIIPIKSWPHLALPAASRQRNSSEAPACIDVYVMQRPHAEKKKTSGWRGFVKAPAPRGTRNVR